MVIKALKYILFAFIFLTVGALIARIKISEVVCVSQNGPCDETLVNELNNIKSLSLGTYGKKLERQLSSSVLVDKFNMQLTLPDKVTVRIIQKTPKYELLDNGRNLKFLIDKDGYVLYQAQEDRFFPVSIDNGLLPQVGTKSDEKTLFALRLTYLMRKNYEISKSSLKHDSLEVEFPQGVKAIFPLEGDLDYLTGGFVLLYNRLNKEGNEFRIDNDKISQIDLRFRNPVLNKQI